MKGASDTAIIPRKLRGLNLDVAPSTPGLYAWYLTIGLDASDSDERLDSDGNDQSSRDLKRALTKFARVHDSPPIATSGVGDYDLRWFAQINRQSIADLEGHQTRLEKNIDNVSTNADTRLALINLLNAASPVFAAPLYIGVADNLNIRLSQHRDDYEAAAEELRRNPSSVSSAANDGPTFGSRLAHAGVSLSHVNCWILPYNDVMIDATTRHDITRQSTRAAEWLLQRIFKPTMGKR